LRKDGLGGQRSNQEMEPHLSSIPLRNEKKPTGPGWGKETQKKKGGESELTETGEYFLVRRPDYEKSWSRENLKREHSIDDCEAGTLSKNGKKGEGKKGLYRRRSEVSEGSIV